MIEPALLRRKASGKPAARCLISRGDRRRRTGFQRRSSDDTSRPSPVDQAPRPGRRTRLPADRYTTGGSRRRTGPRRSSGKTSRPSPADRASRPDRFIKPFDGRSPSRKLQRFLMDRAGPSCLPPSVSQHPANFPPCSR